MIIEPYAISIILTCPVCKKQYKYPKRYNTHLESIHPRWLQCIEETPFNLLPQLITTDHDFIVE